MTGAAVPSGLDAVIRREDAKEENGTVRFATPSVDRWHNIALQGEDLRRGTSVAITGNRIDQSVATTFASLGIQRPTVHKLPRIIIVTTGNEIIPVNRKPKPEQIRNSNVFALKAMLAHYGINAAAKHVADDKVHLTAALRSALSADLVLLTGGVSAGDSDYVPEILRKLKVKEVFHKTAMKPGKPLWFGARGKTRVFAIPGNPWSTQVVFKVYIEPFLRRCFGMVAPLRLALPLAKERRKKDSLQHFFPVRIVNKVGFTSELEAVALNGSGDIRAGLGSDGLAVHPADKQELRCGEIVEFLPWR
jgi:molybdopterin molybdotransferase